MKKLIIELAEVGICRIDVNQAIKMWNDKFSIYKWHDEYTLRIPFRKDWKGYSISEAQAQELIYKIGLISVKSTLLVSGTSFFTKNYIVLELDRLKGIAYNKEIELEVVNNHIFNLNNSLLSI